MGSLAVLLMLPLIFILGIILGINVEKEISLSQDNLSSWVSAFATVTIAILTIVLAKETWSLRLIQLSQIEQIRKDSIKPSVSLYLKSNPAGISFIDIHVKNSGVGTAQNIRFAFKNVSDKGLDEVYDNFRGKLNKLVILEKGISALGPGEHRSSFLLSFIEFHQKHGEKALDLNTEVEIAFEDIEGTPYQSKAYFNFAEYKGISGLGDEPAHEIASHLKKIKEEIGHFASGFRKIKVDVYTSEDREEERKIWEERSRKPE